MFNNDKINKNKEAAIIDGPEAVLNSNEENNPKITDNNPPIIEYITILWGLDEIFLAIAAGIISIPVINNKPTIFIDIAMIAAIKIVNIALALSGFKPSASANS